jgi:hypothetical protein
MRRHPLTQRKIWRHLSHIMSVKWEASLLNKDISTSSELARIVTDMRGDLQVCHVR